MEPTQTNSSPQTRPKRWIFLAGGLMVIAAAVVGFFFYQIQQQAANNLALNPAEVTIQPSGFAPATIQVKKGQIITWTNQDSAEHAIVTTNETTADLDGSEPLQTGDSFSYSFDKPGTYYYNDQSSSTLFKGTVIVE